MDKVNIDFDHLSVVSEECLSNSDDPTNSCSVDAADSNGKNADDASMSNFQSSVPPLTHFENLCYKDIGPNIGKPIDLSVKYSEINLYSICIRHISFDRLITRSAR